MSLQTKVALAGLVILATGCDTQSGTPLAPEPGTAPTLNANAGGSRSQSSDVYAISDGSLSGTASLTRLPNGISTHIKVDAGAIPRGDVVTLWGATFNNPGECALEVCDFPDMDNPLVEGSLVWLGSGIASGGSTTYAGHVMVGDSSGDILQLFGALSPGPGLLNPAGAEIHVILRTHGPPIHGALQSQRTTFLGPDCTVDALAGEPCADLLFAVFQAAP